MSPRRLSAGTRSTTAQPAPVRQQSSRAHAPVIIHAGTVLWRPSAVEATRAEERPASRVGHPPTQCGAAAQGRAADAAACCVLEQPLFDTRLADVCRHGPRVSHGCHSRKDQVMARSRTVSRSASSGRFVTAAYARRAPSRTTTERVGGSSSNARTVYRSASSGRFVSASTAARRPSTTIAQQV